MSQWRAGLVAAAMSALVGFGCGGVEPLEEEETSSGAAEQYLQEALGNEHDNQCKAFKCEEIKRDKNITHVFLDFGKCSKLKDFRVFVFTKSRGKEEVTDRLKKKGGPCQELNADYRFELPGPDHKAKVCVVFKDYVANVRIGSKAGGECTYEDSCPASKPEPNKCEKCGPHK
jgi:hypothetical protein